MHFYNAKNTSNLLAKSQKEKQEKLWLQENKEAIQEYNQRIEQRRVFISIIQNKWRVKSES